ncbi:glycosyltransferase family 2 protein [Salipiger abyssi]|uniref:glycosyltransferase family 2 protein n=1 Tax=Salipiger abyssi TaxID=1250539 RepID=UPI004058AEF7
MDVIQRDWLRSRLQRSGLFDPAFYTAEYPDVAQTGIDPLRHFLRYGMALGRRPGPGFDPIFYAAEYPDVAGGEPAALWHFLSHGAQEGRQPTRQAAQVRRGLTRIRQLQALLWGGLGDSAETELAALHDDFGQPDSVRLEAGTQLAAWYDFTGRDARARAVLESMESLPERFARTAARLIPLAMLYLKDGRRRAARQALDAIRPEEHDNHRVLALADLAEGQARIDRINGIFSARDLAALRLRDPAAGAGLANLTADPCEPATDHGRVSVILPAWQAADRIATAIGSLQAQSYRNLEIIVVDDASTDGTFDLVTAMAREDDRIVPLRQAENGGPYAARNLGLAQARGDFIATHDADDWSHPQKLALQVAELAGDPALTGVIAHWARVRPGLEITTNWRLGAQLMQWSHSSFLFRRGVAERLGGWDAVRVSGDMEYIWRVQAAFGPDSVRRILPDVPLAFAADDAGSLTRNPLTHVRSTYGGLRHYYREICRYWHARAPQGLSPEQQAGKWAMLPAAILPGQDGSDRVDTLLLGDCCDPRVLAEMARIAAERDPGRIGLVHRPDPGFTERRIGYAMEFPEPFFELLQRANVCIACPEDRVRAARRIAL